MGWIFIQCGNELGPAFKAQVQSGSASKLNGVDMERPNVAKQRHRSIAPPARKMRRLQAAIMDGAQPVTLTRHKILFGPMPLDWEQKRRLMVQVSWLPHEISFSFYDYPETIECPRCIGVG